jgi:hypothetical protein
VFGVFAEQTALWAERPFISFTERPLFELKDFLAARTSTPWEGLGLMFNV